MQVTRSQMDLSIIYIAQWSMQVTRSQMDLSIIYIAASVVFCISSYRPPDYMVYIAGIIWQSRPWPSVVCCLALLSAKWIHLLIGAPHMTYQRHPAV